MNDPTASDLVRRNDIVNLFRYLGPMWIVVCMQILEDLLARGLFYPNPDRYQDQLKAAGIFVERMEVAMLAVLHKAARNMNDEDFAKQYAPKVARLDDQQRREIREFWRAPPQPGLVAGTQPASSAIGNVAFDKYVDLFSECCYDMNYKIPADQSFAYSSILQLRYLDGQSIEIDFEKELAFRTLTSAAARDAMAQGMIGRGGRIFPAVLAPRTVPRMWRAREEAHRIQNEDVKAFATVAMTGVAFVLSVPTMPAGIIEEGAIASSGVSRRRVNGVAVAKIKPLNGQVSVGGGFENPNGTNLNPVRPGSGGPTKNIPNHVLGGMEDMDRLIEAGSVKNLISSRLRYVDVNWPQGTNAAAKVMAPGGKVQMNVWTQSAAEQQALRSAFENAGFKNVRVVQVGMDGSSTMVMADF